MWRDSLTGDVYDFNIYANQSYQVSNDKSIRIVACGIMTDGSCANVSSICANGTNLGVYDENGLQFNNGTRLELDYINGDTCSGNIPYTSTVEFQCNTNGMYIEHNTLLDSGCNHYFIWNTPLACKGEISQCRLQLQDRFIDLSMLSKLNGAWIVNTGMTDYPYVLFNPCYSMSSYLAWNTYAKAISCSSNSFACIINKNNELIEIGSLDTATMIPSSNYESIILTGTSKSRESGSNRKYSVKIIFSANKLLFGDVAFKRSSNIHSETQINLQFGTSLLNTNVIVDSRGSLTVSDNTGVCDSDTLLYKLSNSSYDYIVSGEKYTFHINFCSFSKNCHYNTSVCMVYTTGNTQTTVLLSNSTKRNILKVNTTFYQLIMSSEQDNCGDDNRPYLTIFYISCDTEYSQTLFKLEHVSKSKCLYLFTVRAPEYYCKYYNNTNTDNTISSENNAKTVIIFFIVSFVGLFALFIAFLLTALCYKRFSRGERWFYKLKFSLNKKTMPQYRFSKLQGSEIGQLINSDISDSDDETITKPDVISAESSTIVTHKMDDSPKLIENDDNSDDDEFIKL